jgi:hypothetical protein
VAKLRGEDVRPSTGRLALDEQFINGLKEMTVNNEREREAREALERVARDSENVGGSSMARVTGRLRDHFSGANAIGQGEGGSTDLAEVWGRRIGRAISVVLFIVLLWGVIAHFAGR